MNPFLKRYNAEWKAFNRLRKLCESKVVRWEYWKESEWQYDPEKQMLWAQHFGKDQARVSKEEAGYAYGYDKSGRVVVIREGGPLNEDENCLPREFLRHSGNKIIGSSFLGDKLSDVFEATLSQDRIVRVERLMGNLQWDWKTIEWRQDKIVKVAHGFRGRKPYREITYNDSGKAIADVDLTKPIKRKPLPKGVTMNSLAKEIRDRLVKAVVTTVTKAKVKEPAYCLALNYDCEGNPLLLPELGIGLDSERQVLLKRGGRDAKRDIWEPEQFSICANNRTALKDKELARACDLFNRELEYEGSDEPARKLILQAAADLAKVDWKGKLDTTQDFIVYAVDTDGADLRKNLKLTVPPKQLAKLKAAKLL